MALAVMAIVGLLSGLGITLAALVDGSDKTFGLKVYFYHLSGVCFLQDVWHLS